MPLSLVEIGVKQSIKKIIGKDEIKKHLENLGFIIGDTITVVAENNGNMIVNVKDSRIAIDKYMAGRVIVSSGI